MAKKKTTPTRGRPRLPLGDSPRARFAAALLTLREAAGLTVVEAAARLGKHGTTWNHWENGRRLPDITQLRAIAKVLGCRVERLLPE